MTRKDNHLKKKIKLKNAIVLKADLTVQKKESATRRIGNWKLPSQKSKKKKKNVNE